MEIHYWGVGEASMVHAEILGCSYYSDKTVVPVTWGISLDIGSPLVRKELF